MEQDWGKVLWRGGERIPLVKELNRFAIALKQPQDDPRDWVSAFSYETIPYLGFGTLIVVTVSPEEQDMLMAHTRNLPQVWFVSHIYHRAHQPHSLFYPTHQITIQFQDPLEAGIIEAIAHDHGLELLQPLAGVPRGFVYQLTARSWENPLKISDRLAALPEVMVAEPNVIVPQQPFHGNRDPQPNPPWYLDSIHSEEAWALTQGDPHCVVAIADDTLTLDFDPHQPQIVAPRDLQGKDFMTPAPGRPSHGDHCAQVIVGTDQPRSGLAPHCGFMPIRTVGYVDDWSVEQIFDWAQHQGADVICCPWGAAMVNFPLSLRQSVAIHRAATEGRDGKGCVVIFPAGNANRPLNGLIYERYWPENQLNGPTEWLNGFAIHPDVIAIAACTREDKKAAYGNWGKQIAIAAPSEDGHPHMVFGSGADGFTTPELSTTVEGEPRFSPLEPGHTGGGTSLSAAIVAGVAALMLSVNPELTAQEVKQLLQKTADPICDRQGDPQLGLPLGGYQHFGHSLWFGRGKVNAGQAVAAAQRYQPPAPMAETFQWHQCAQTLIKYNAPQGLTSAIAVEREGTIRDLAVALELEHGFLGDLEIYLRSPQGHRILLQNRSLGNRTHLRQLYNRGNRPALAQLDHHPCQGQWQLWIIDHTPTDEGILHRWQLSLTLEPAIA